MPDLPAFKARPEWIVPVLALVGKNQGNYQALEESIVCWWRDQSGRTRPPSAKNSIRAVFGPTLRHLRLVRGTGDEITLTHLAQRLLEANRKGEASVKRELATQLTRLDSTSWVGILPLLQQAKGQLSIDQILAHLSQAFPSVPADRQKVRKYLNYFRHAGLIDESENQVRLRPKQFDAAKAGAWPALPSAKRFARELRAAYAELASSGIYVAIPSIREAVCRRLGIFDEEFDKLLSDTRKESAHSIIQLTAPMTRASGGLRIAGRYVYYMAIHERRGTHD